ncbi:MAG: redox-regulated ATPase YchF [Candidatus Aminicenantes bacterium]|nr:redox-regulated ATPase YchF [Candidatus Aminicenantes bacterium]
MKICLIGLPQSGKSSLFSALTGLGTGEAAAKGTEPVAVVKVPDLRVENLTSVYKPKKKTFAAIEFSETAGLTSGEPGRTGFAEQALGKLRAADALLAAVRGFRDPAVAHPLESIDPLRDLRHIEAELLLADLGVIESRLEKLVKQIAAKKSDRDVREKAALERCRAFLESETPLRRADLTADEELLLRGYRFLTQKPFIVALNLDEADISTEAEALRPFKPWLEGLNSAVIALSARLEMEIRQLPEEDARRFLQDFGIERPARAKLIATAYALMGLVSFFTVGGDEVKAWTIRSGTPAARAAGVIHSDIERGFIRAEVVGYEDFAAKGNLQDCKSDGTLRLEGKDYPVRDGDIINFRFAV